MLGSLTDAWRHLFPGRARLLLVLTLLGLLGTSLMDMLGVAAILPLVQLATGAPIEGYLARIDAIAGHPGQRALVLIVAAVLVLAFALKAALSLAITWWSQGFMMRREVALSAELLERYLREPYLRHRTRSIAQILRDSQEAVSQAYGNVAMGWVSVAGSAFSAIVIMGLLLALMPVPALAAIAYFALCGAAVQFALARRNVRQGRRQMEASLRSSGTAIEAVVGYREVRLHNRTRAFVERFREARLEAAEAGRVTSFLQVLPRYVLEVLFIVGIALILALIMFTAPPAGAVPSILLFAGACVRVLPTFTSIVGSLGMIRVGRPGLDLVVSQLEHPLAQDDTAAQAEAGPQRRVLHERAAHLRLDDVAFTYPDGHRPVLQDVSLDVPAGTSIAFVGGSGSGKTTLVDIVLGLIDPDAGTVTVDGHLIHEDLPRWFDRVGYVPQDVVIMDASVAENVAFGERGDDIDTARVEAALERAQLTDVVAELPAGIHEAIGEHGTRLSGGQRQRLGIARALYGAPSMLVLDEATSALDNETEARITATIRELAGSMTVLVVAHRLSTVRHVDQLAFFSGGRIAALGTFAQVQAASPEFARLVELGRLPGGEAG